MFTEQTIRFLQENRFRNDREWFAAHKADCARLVLEPLDALAEAVAPAVAAADEWIVTRPASVRSRIYRDLRYVRDGMLYREDMWLSFKRDKKRYPNYPEFYFYFTPTAMSYGCGFYTPTAGTMAALREMILKHDAPFEKAQAVCAQGFAVSGDVYKRSRYPDQPEVRYTTDEVEEPETLPPDKQTLRVWLDRKTISVERPEKGLEALFDPALPQKVAAGFTALKPVYAFFLRAAEYGEEDGRIE